MKRYPKPGKEQSEQSRKLLAFIIGKFYTLWGSVLLVVPALITLCGIIALKRVSEFASFKGAFAAMFPLMFSHFAFTWFVSISLAAISFFFGMRLAQAGNGLVARGILMMIPALFFIGFGLYMNLIYA